MGNEAESLAIELANAIADLISVQLQLNYATDIGPGERRQLNVQPVAPFAINEHWNVISRTILPLIHQDDIPLGTDESGVGDIT